METAPIPRRLADHCPATDLAVQEREEQGFDACPLCGLPSWEHRSEQELMAAKPLPSRE